MKYIFDNSKNARRKTDFSQGMIRSMVANVVLSEYLEAEYGIFLDVPKNGWANACCPFPDHRDDNPSFGVNDDKGIYKCFGCGKKGDVISFIRDMDGLSFRKALIKLQKYTGDVEEGNYELKAHVRHLSKSIEDYLSDTYENQYPAGMSEQAFLMSVADSIKDLESYSNYNEKVLAWSDKIYKQIDNFIFKQEYDKVYQIWQNLGTKIEEIKGKIDAKSS